MAIDRPHLAGFSWQRIALVWCSICLSLAILVYCSLNDHDQGREEFSSHPSSYLRYHQHQYHPRHLQRGAQGHTERGRTVLTFLYLTVLGLCFLTPVLYYCRLTWEERANDARIRQLQARGLSQAVGNNSTSTTNPNGHANTMNEDDEAARRKYMAERMARLRQLAAPVKLTLTQEHILLDGTAAVYQQQSVAAEESISSSSKSKAEIQQSETAAPKIEHDSTTPSNSVEIVSPADDDDDDSKESQQQPTDDDAIDDDEEDDDPENAGVICIPIPGMHVTPTTETRRASGVCTICLSSFRVGSTVVWSSNPVCEHVFHEECIIAWLLRQREGPLCPCCRRDFVLDPLEGEQRSSSSHSSTSDSGGEEDNNHNNHNPSRNNTATHGGLPDILEEPVVDGPEQHTRNPTRIVDSPQTLSPPTNNSSARTNRFPFRFRWAATTNTSDGG